jgi:hypothetical protein
MPDEAMPTPGPKAVTRRWPWVVLATILIVFVVAIILIRPAANFGGLQDDAMYFASAKAIAAGQGYLLPSFPGGLTTLKYPELYPWLLSWIWRWNPSFPANVVPAIGLTLFFGCWFLVACFLIARKTLGLSPAWALAVTALCAFNFFTLLVGGSVLSDLPFGALALTAVLAADRSLEPDGHWLWMALAGALAGLSIGLRTVGVTIVAGIALFALLRRSWRRAALVCFVSGAISLPWLLPPVLRLFGPHADLGPLPQGWAQTQAFYTSYFSVWRLSVPNWATQRAVFLKNFLSVCLEPGIFLLFPLSSRGAYFVVLGSLMALGTWVGIVLQIRRAGWKAIHCAFLFYLAMVLPWPFPPQRFLVPFVPLLFGGLIIVFREIALYVSNAFKSGAAAEKRAQAAALGVVLFAMGGTVMSNYAYVVPRRLSALMAGQRSLLAEKQQAYRWIDAHTTAESRFIAYDDVLLYLYTGRQAIRPIASSTASSYDNDPVYAKRDAAHLGDVARYVHADYCVASSNDFDVELGDDRTILLRRENQMLSGLPLVFKTDSGHIRIYDLRCFQTPAATGCTPPPSAQDR